MKRARVRIERDRTLKAWVACFDIGDGSMRKPVFEVSAKTPDEAADRLNELVDEVIDALFELRNGDEHERGQDVEALREASASELETVKNEAFEQLERGKPYGLYWCTTEDHDEDWLILARSRLEARRFHATEEGYALDDVKADLVAHVPKEMNVETGWPSNAEIEALGGKILIDRDGERRVVEFNRVALIEGGLEAKIEAGYAALARDPEARRQWEENVRKILPETHDTSTGLEGPDDE